MNLYAIGDIQGCHPRLLVLMDRIRAECAHPRYLFVGDLVNRGPRSLDTLHLIRSLGDQAATVLGNHDLHLLATAHGVRKSGRSDTLDDILQAPDRTELLDWLRRQPLARIEDGYLMVHAGVLPQWTAEQTLALAHEVETVLRGPDYVDFLRVMYGNAPARWDDSLTGDERLRCIVNALTRMRFCSADGEMEFTTSESANAGPRYLPWFDVPGRRTENITVVFGHWSAMGLVLRDNLVGLDTGCVWGGKLTAVALTSRHLLQVSCPEYQKIHKAG